MERIKTILVEDEPIIAADLKNQLEKLGYEVEGIFEDAESIIQSLENFEYAPDILLMDIQLEGDMDGIQAASIINEKFKIPIIFITSNTDANSFQRAKLTYPSAFLSKPFRIKDITNAMELALEKPNQSVDKNLEFLSDRIFLKSKNSLDRVMYEHILYVEADGAYTKIVTKDRTHVISQSLSKTEQSLNWKSIVRVHRSFLVNLSHVDRITEGYLLSTDFKVPMSRSYNEDVMKLFVKL